MRYFSIPLLGLLLLCTGCNNNENENQQTEINIENGIISISATSSIIQKIKTEKVEKSTYQPTFSTSSVVKAIPTSYAEIATPFGGRIVQSFVHLGQNVSKGSALFSISSPSFFETSKAYFEEKQEMEQALKNLNREKDLLANKVGVKKEVEEAEVNYQLKKQDFENALSALRVFQVEPEKVKLGEPLIVRSPISGKIVANNIVIGQYIKEDAEPMTIVADLEKVWVVAQVKEKDINMIQHLEDVDVHLCHAPNENIKGKIYHISEMLDPSTRSVEVIIECDNRKGLMKPFMYATVTLSDAPTKAILIPTKAILQGEDFNYVLVEKGKNAFSKTAITTSAVIDDKTVITKGLSAGDVIITEGAFYLLDAK